MGVRAVVVLLVAAGLAVAAPSVSSAAPSPGAIGCSAPALTGPSSAGIGSVYTIVGCGFLPRSIVGLEITEAGGCCRAQQIYTDDAGRFEFSSQAWARGLYRVRASVARRWKWSVVAEWSFQAI